MYFGVLDKPGAAELEDFAEYITAGMVLYGERWNDEAEVCVRRPLEDWEMDIEIAERINEYLRHGNC